MMAESGQTAGERDANGDVGGEGRSARSDAPERAQTGDLVSDRELGLTEPLGPDRDGPIDLKGSTWGADPDDDPGSAATDAGTSAG